MECVALSLSADISSIRSYFIQLTWRDAQAGYDVHFPSNRQNATITIIIDDCKLSLDMSVECIIIMSYHFQHKGVGKKNLVLELLLVL